MWVEFLKFLKRGLPRRWGRELKEENRKTGERAVRDSDDVCQRMGLPLFLNVLELGIQQPTTSHQLFFNSTQLEVKRSRRVL